MTSPADQPCIVVRAEDAASVEELRRPLENAGYRVAWQDLRADGADPQDRHLVIVEGSSSLPEALHCCRRLRGKAGEAFVPILFVTADPSPAVRLAGLENGADTYLLRPFAAGELLAQVRAFLRIKETHDRLTEKTAEVHRVNKRLQFAYQQIDTELELARRIQLSFLPQSLPELPNVRFAVHYHLIGQVGGDFYDVFRLDENHLGLYVADAMGHGVPASLLTIFVKKGVRPKEIFGNQYRLVPPGEILKRLNRELIDQHLSEVPFITMVYGLLDFRQRQFRFARAGHPYPLYVPRQGEPRLLQSEGSLLGVFETTFPEQTHQLHPGDKLLIYSDGIDSADNTGHALGAESMVACAARLRDLPVEEFVRHMAREPFGKEGPKDDLTLLGLEIVE